MPTFIIAAENSPANLALLNEIKEHFSIKSAITISTAGLLVLRSSSLKELLKIREHFTNYRLQSTKRFHF